MRRFSGIVLIITLTMYCAWADLGALAAEESDDVAFSELVVTTSTDHLLLFGIITNGFSEEMVAGLKSGIPVTFTFFVELAMQTDSAWVSIADSRFKHSLAYDTLKDQYRVELSEFANRQFTLDNLEEAKTLMSQLNGYELIELARLKENGTYRLRIRAELFEQTLPLSLHYILPFVSWWDRKIDWQTLDFSY